MSGYPDAIDSFRTVENLPEVTYDEDDTKTIFAEDINNLTSAVVAIQTTLGENPEGGTTDVVNRLDFIESDIGGKEPALGFTPEDVANKSTTTTLGTSNTLYPTQNAVKTYVDNNVAPFSSGGVLGTIHYYTSDDTWTKPAGLKYIIVEVQAGGGGGGGCASSSSGQSAVGKPGGAGGYSRKKYTAGSLSSTEVITVGAGGGGGVGNASGSNGGSSAFSGYLSCNGGSGGTNGSSSSTITIAAGGAGGAAGSGDYNIDGQAGDSVARPIATMIVGGRGGNSALGIGGARVDVGGSNTTAAGKDATGYGAGGGGCCAANGGGSQNGGDGGDGIVIVYEY